MHVKTLILIVSITVFAVNRISAQGKNDLIGKWDSFIPMAPLEFKISSQNYSGLCIHVD